MNEAICAYMAGIIDGEGCLSISKQIRKNRRSPSFRSSVTVSNTDKRLVDFFVRYAGGNSYKRPDSRIEKNWADSYTWHCPDGMVVDFLECIKQYLIIKREQAEILIDFQNKKSSYVRKSLGQGLGSAPLSEEEISEKNIIYLKIKSLNLKGKYSRSLKQKGGDQ